MAANTDNINDGSSSIHSQPSIIRTPSISSLPAHNTTKTPMAYFLEDLLGEDLSDTTRPSSLLSALNAAVITDPIQLTLLSTDDINSFRTSRRNPLPLG